jgi:hypothetical protein
VTTTGCWSYPQVHHHNRVSVHNQVEFIPPSTSALYTISQPNGVQNCGESLRAVSCRSCKIPTLQLWADQSVL